MRLRFAINRLFQPFRQRSLRKRYCALGGGSVSVIGNNCVAGMFCHDLGLRFDTPTVNLAFTFQEFLTLAENLPDSLSAPIEDVPSAETFPVGLLKVEGAPSIRVKFIHYKTFAEAVDAWRRRTARVDRNRVVLLATDNSNASPEDVARFLALPYPKLCYTQDLETARLLGDSGVFVPGPFPNGFAITEFSGWTGKRHYHCEKALAVCCPQSART